MTKNALVYPTKSQNVFVQAFPIYPAVTNTVTKVAPICFKAIRLIHVDKPIEP